MSINPIRKKYVSAKAWIDVITFTTILIITRNNINCFPFNLNLKKYQSLLDLVSRRNKFNPSKPPEANPIGKNNTANEYS